MGASSSHEAREVSVGAPAGRGPEPPPRPRLCDATGAAPAESSLLDEGAIAMLAERLRKEERLAWRLVFKASRDGQSFNRFLKHATAQGPIVIAVRDGHGRAFGGYVSESLRTGPDWFGGYGCFLFNAHPPSEAAVHKSSGSNANFVYCNEGMSQLPNGVAFGGHRDGRYFGLWLHEGFDSGEGSGPCSTYEGGVLPHRGRFRVREVEVWATGPKPEPEGEGGEEPARAGPGGTVLGRRREDANFMAMAGRELHSDKL